MAQKPGSGGGSVSSSASGAADTSLTKIFVGGLAWETECESMRHYFEQFGEIAEAVVIVDKHTGRSKGYGFVTFLEAEAARRACANPAPFIDGRRTNCNLAVLGANRSRAGSPLFQGARFVPYLNDFGVQAQQAYGGSPNFRQPLPFAFQPYPPSLGYPAYPSEYYASPNMYNPYMGPSQQMTAAVYQSQHVPPSPTFQHGHAQPPGQQEQQQLRGGPFAMPPSPVNLPSYFLPPPYIGSPGPVSPSGSQGASTPRFVLQVPTFTPGGGPERQSPS